MLELRDFSFIQKYFAAEKQESLLFVILGISAIALSFVFFFFIKTNPPLFKGAAVPLLLIGLIQLVVGYTVYSRTEKQAVDIAYNMGMEPLAFSKNKELPRMETVMKNFAIYRWIEIALIIAGLVLIFLFRQDPDKSFWYGLGITLAVQAVLMLGADYFAEKRGAVYIKELQRMLT